MMMTIVIRGGLSSVIYNGNNLVVTIMDMHWVILSGDAEAGDDDGR